MTRSGSLNNQRVVGVVIPDGGTGSAGYLRRLLTHLADGTVSVPLRSADDAHRIALTSPDDIVTPDGGAGWIDDTFVSQGGDGVAQVSFTSGTTGAAKGVLLSKTAFHDVVTRLIDVMGLTDEVREYIGVPVSHSFGYARARAVLHVGGQVYLPPNGFDLSEIRTMLTSGDINAISAVPSLWRVVLAAASSFGPERQHLRWIEIGSQKMSADEKIALRELFPSARIVQHYGLTEASRTTFLRIDETDPAKLGSIGQPTGDAGIKVNNDNRLVISGPHLATALLTADGEVAVKRTLITSDLGSIDAEGYVWFDGRADDMINCGGIKLDPESLENAMRAVVTDAGDFAILRRADPIRGEGLALMLTPQSAPHADALKAAAITAATDKGAAPGSDVPLHHMDAFPRTDTGKLQRHLLRAPDTEPSQNREPSATFTGPLADLMGTSVDPSLDFLGAGGDSLTHLQVQLLLEQKLGTAPLGWEQTPLIDLAAAIATGLPTDGHTGAPPLPKGTENMNPKGIGFWALVAEDYRTNDATLGSQGFWALFVNRFGNWRMSVRPKLLRMPLSIAYRVLRKLVQITCGIKLDYTVAVGRRVKLEHFGGMILGARSIGDDTIVRQNTTFGIRTIADLNAKPVLGQRVDVGAGAVIAGNVQIGDDAIIGANSVVYFSIPNNAIVQGVPAQIVGYRPDASSTETK